MNSQRSIRKNERLEQAWNLHLAGVPQFQIATEMGITAGRVCQLIKEAAALHPVCKLSLEERIALSEARWQQSEQELIDQIAEQRVKGRTVVETITFTDGSQQQKVTQTRGVDPALLRALSTHHDRRARQLCNQMAPDANVQAVNVQIAKDFINQANTAGQLSAADWNSKDDAPIDV